MSDNETLLCAHPDCNDAAEKQYRCGECGDYFCAMHIYQASGYICKIHFHEFGLDEAAVRSKDAEGGFDIWRQFRKFFQRNRYE